MFPLESDKYIILERVGVGAYSYVYHALLKESDIHLAIKIIDLESDDLNLDKLSSETQTLSLLHHPNIIQIYGSFCHESSLWILMPQMLCSLSDLIKKYFINGIKDEILLASILKQVLIGLEYLHTEGYIHRDIKAANLLLSTEGEIKIGDFGIVGKSFKESRHTFTGTPCWMAPEVMENGGEGYNSKADIWSLGITLLELAFGKAPYSHFEPMKVLLYTLKNDPPTCDTYNDRGHTFSKEFQSFISKCLRKDVDKRYTVKKLLKHKFLNKAKDSKYILKFHFLNKVSDD